MGLLLQPSCRLYPGLHYGAWYVSPQLLLTYLHDIALRTRSVLATDLASLLFNHPPSNRKRVAQLSFSCAKAEQWNVAVLPHCTGLLTKIMPEFTKRNTKVIALSCNPVDSHVQWQADIMKHSGSAGAFPYPIVDDTSRELAVELGMVDPEEVSATGAPMTCRAVFIISPDKKVKLSILYPASCGRNFDEVLRALDSLQMTVKHKVATPVNWVKGGECMVVPSVKDADMAALFPLGVRIEAVPSGKGYLR